MPPDPQVPAAPRRYCPACGAAIAAAARFCGRCGTALSNLPGTVQSDTSVTAQPNVPGMAAPAGEAPQRPGAGRHRPARRNPKRWIVAGIAVAVAVIAGIALVAVPLAQQYLVNTNPADTVRSYFQALADRDGDRARALLSPLTFTAPSASGEQQAEQEMLSARTLRDPGYTPPRLTDVAMVAARQEPSNPVVLARFDLADGHHQMQLQLFRSSAGSFGRWLISNGLGDLNLPGVDFRGAALLVAGNTIPATGLELRQVFPGSYLVTLPKGPLLEAVPLTVTSNGGSADRLTVRVRQDVQATVQNQVRAYLDACAASIEAHPPHCPIGYGYPDPVTDLHYKIVTYPVLSFNAANGAANVLGMGGRFQVSGRENLPGGKPFTAEYEFSVQGTVLPGDGKPVFTPPS